MDQSLAVRLVDQVRIVVPTDVNESDDLVVAQMFDRTVDSPLVKPQPVIMGLAVGQHAKPIAVNTDASPLAKPPAHFCPRTNPGQCLGLKVEGVHPDLNRSTSQLAGSIPPLFHCGTAMDLYGNRFQPIEFSFDPVWGLLQEVGPQLA